MNKCTKTARFKIIKPIFPTTSWKEFDKIFLQLSEEVRAASNRCIQLCNFYYANDKIDSEYNAGVKPWDGLYDACKEMCPNLYSKNMDSIGRGISQRYFKGENSYRKMMERGDGNPPMSFKKGMPIPIDGFKNRIRFEVVDGKYYNLMFALVNTNFRKSWNEQIADGKVKNAVIMKSGQFKVAVEASRGMKEIADRCISSEYKIGGSKLVKRGSEYYFHLCYSFEVENDVKLYPEKIVGVDLGIRTPAVCATNVDINKRAFIGGDWIVNRKMEFQRKRRDMQRAACILGKDGHGRKAKVEFVSPIRHKEKNYTETCNRRFAKQIVDFAIRNNCGTIKMEFLKGFFSQYKRDKYLRNWTYFQLQEYIEQKAAQHGINVLYVNPKYTSQTCSKCGHREPANRDGGYFHCQKCGYKANADFNAALNIVRKEPIKKKEKEL